MSKSSPTPSHIPIDSAATPLGRGAIIGRYLILGLVGRGGMGEVYAAYDPELDRKVAVKLLRVRPATASRRPRGASGRCARRRRSRGCRTPTWWSSTTSARSKTRSSSPWSSSTGNTAHLLAAARPRSWQEILRVFIAAGRGLTAAHEKGWSTATSSPTT